jgi:hydrogenase maturation protein HypF
MRTWHIHVTGRVQGVGFRPFIYRIARSMKLQGTVSNESDGVHININATVSDSDIFVEDILSHAPSAAHILNITKECVADIFFDDFSIIESSDLRNVKVLVTPDLAICSICKRELHEIHNKRNGYAFTTCTQCGPRFSIVRRIPYDRKETSMKEFVMCEGCKREYEDVDDRRFYSQTNSCPACGISLFWLKGGDKTGDYISVASQLLKEGNIIAVKGIGGFLLVADACNEKAVNKLRDRKKRPFKPFACLFRNIAELEKTAQINNKEKALLTSSQAPIVLLRLKKGAGNLAMNAIAPGLDKIGAMLPNAPILELISSKYDGPLVATSANITGSPIIYRDEDAILYLKRIADAILSNDRNIHFPQDDSVAVISPEKGQQIIIRRSRGYAPSVELPENLLKDHVLAFGAEMKSAFAITSCGNTYLSQYLGDTSSYDSQRSFDMVFEHLFEMIKPEIEVVLVDAHPAYYSSQKGKEWSAQKDLSVQSYQHHKAHFASILAEKELLNSSRKVLGVIWDGNGYGDDGHIWGSEFFIYQSGKMKRMGSLSYFPYLCNDRMALEPTVATLAASWPNIPDKKWRDKYFSKYEQRALLKKIKDNSIGIF